MNRIYFVRHAEGRDNVARRFSSTWMDHPLTERGRLQAAQTGEFLAGTHLDGIFCSPMKRTHETAEIIASQLNMGFTDLDELREVNVGDLEGKDFNDENWKIYHAVTNQWYAGNVYASFPGGEDYVAVWKRVRRGLLKILQNHDGCRFLVVGHGGVFVSTLREYCPGLETGWLQNVAYYNCAITELDMEIVKGELRGQIVSWARNDHLSGDAFSTTAAIAPLSSIQAK